MGMIASVLAHGGGLGAYDELILLALFGALGIGMGLVLRAARDTSKDQPADDEERPAETAKNFEWPR
jgi:hypothetical protein